MDSHVRQAKILELLLLCRVFLRTNIFTNVQLSANVPINKCQRSFQISPLANSVVGWSLAG